MAWALAVSVIFVLQYENWVKPLILGQLLGAASSVFFVGPHFGEFWGQRLLDIGWCIAVLFSAFGVGSVLTSRWTRDHNLLTGLFALAAGFWALAVTVLVIGAVDVTAVRCVFVFAACWVLPPPRRFLKKIVWPETDGWTWIMLIVVIIAVLINFLGATTPPFEYDELEYHLGAPVEYIKNGRISFLPHNFYSNLPQLTEMLYLLGVVTRSLVAPKMLHWVFGILSALAVYGVASRLWSRRIGMTAAALFYCLPFVQDLSQTGRIDLATTFFATLAFGGVLLANDGNRWIWLGAMAAGCAVATKWTAVAVVFLPSLVFLLATRKSILLISGFCCVAGVGILPWLIKNLVLAGNPVYPLLHTHFPSPYWTDSQAALFAFKHYAKFRDGGWKELGERLWQYSFIENGATPVLLMTAPLVLLLRGIKGRLRRAVWLFVAAYAGWALLTFRPWRFLMPALPLAAAIGACALDSVGKWSRPFVLAVILIGFSGMGLSLLIDSEADRQPPQVSVLNLVMGQVSQHDFQARLGRHVFEPIVWMNDHLPENAKVLYLGEARTALARHPVIWASAFDKPPDINVATLRTRGITHVYINDSEWQRLKFSYGYLKEVDPIVFVDSLLKQAESVHIASPNQMVIQLK